VTLKVWAYKQRDASLMPSFKPTDLWNAEPHTLAKIEIVRRYLFLWFRILGTRSNRLTYIDGFSGPGRYLNSEQSSPTAALTGAKAAFDELVRSGRAPKEWFFYFIEKEPEFSSRLQTVISEAVPPKEFKWDVQTGTFEEKLNGILDEIKILPGGIPPTFAFIDPFGATGVPFSHVAEILKHRSCEVLINLDSDGIGRLAAAQAIEKNQKNLDAIFGGDMWRSALEPHAKLPLLCSQVLALYKSRLRSLPGVEYFFAFAMRSKREMLNYHLVFASQHWLGLEKMKETMKAVDQSGSYSFSDDTVGQVYFDFSDAVEPARRMLKELAGKWRPYGDYRKFALNESPFSNPKAILRYLKSQGKVEVQWIGEPSKTGFPEKRIRFIMLNP
jgi:three-Cys-motif partner protein